MSPVVEKYPMLDIPNINGDYKTWPYVYTHGAMFVNMYNWGMDPDNRGNFIRWAIGSSGFQVTPKISNSEGHCVAPFFGPSRPGNIIYLFGGKSEHYFMYQSDSN